MYDYIIVGGGSSGCVLAARLSEMQDARVLLLEAGPKDRNPYIHIPVGFFKMTGGPLTWGLKTAPQRHVNNREIPFAQARVLGGGGSINAEVFTRGAREDYDRWAGAEGCDGWSYDEVMPYFKRSEDNEIFADEYHGTGGPLGVSSPISPNRMSKVFVQACQQAGLPYNPDFNGARQDGCGLYQTTTRNARRCSAAVGYLNGTGKRQNLDIWPECKTTRILLENGRAVGVEFERKGQVEQVRASREVIVAAGAIGSPKLLMLSGIGPADHLRSRGIEVRADLAGVGQNLQDHFGTDIIYELNGQYSFDKYAKPHWMLWAGLEYMLFRKGPVASNIVEGGAFWFADKASKTVDTQFHFLAGAGVEEGIPAVPSGAGVTMNSYFLRPRSRGSVTLSSTDPTAAPVVDPNYLADPYDLQMSVQGVKQMRDIMAQSAFAPFIRGEHMPGQDLRSDKDYENYIRQYGRTCYHPVGTCKMGVDEMAVVDPELRVRGIEGLRVADSSVMPSLVSSNTNAPSIMIGEKASDLIRAAV
ncbi:alanine-phosphoribitol ligase [Marinobacterium nitratireducens]|uniref:Alanine-phosphoribitol ligase n=1 Tax=Marinobacterium nitratireducens TaxID=518897 RepID=A0A917ZJX4_9GAMM|nr:GMC family oxidoreductase N-terminal domain-containing protein [Marinobacterium nitratireducens]GGO83907.1 alanine-phosphoribitol ligase [Marinobacterium nitratireducens]